MVVAFQPLLPLSGPFFPDPFMLFRSSLPDAAELPAATFFNPVPASLLPQGCSSQASSAPLPLPELPLLLDAAVQYGWEPQTCLWEGLMQPRQEQGCSGVLGSSLDTIAWLGWPPPASSSLPGLLSKANGAASLLSTQQGGPFCGSQCVEKRLFWTEKFAFVLCLQLFSAGH